MQNFRHLTAEVKFHQICTLTSSFCWKCKKFLLEKYRGVIYISWYWRVMQNFKKSRFVVSKMTRIWWILIQALKSKKSTLWLIPFVQSWTKKKEKRTCGLENDTRNLANFCQNTLRRQNLCFSGVFLSKIQNSWAKNLQRSYVQWHWRMIKNLNRNWLVVSQLT